MNTKIVGKNINLLIIRKHEEKKTQGKIFIPDYENERKLFENAVSQLQSQKKHKGNYEFISKADLN